jgi:hypothetical protein
MAYVEVWNYDGLVTVSVSSSTTVKISSCAWVARGSGLQESGYEPPRKVVRCGGWPVLGVVCLCPGTDGFLPRPECGLGQISSGVCSSVAVARETVLRQLGPALGCTGCHGRGIRVEPGRARDGSEFLPGVLLM